MKPLYYLLGYMYIGWMKLYDFLFCFAIATTIVCVSTLMHFGPGKFIDVEPKTQQEQILDQAKPGVNGGK